MKPVLKNVFVKMQNQTTAAPQHFGKKAQQVVSSEQLNKVVGGGNSGYDAFQQLLELQQQAQQDLDASQDLKNDLQQDSLTQFQPPLPK